MKILIVPFFLIVNVCSAQGWQTEVMIGASGYNGDLTEKLVQLKTIRPGVSANIKYNIDNTIIVRGGFAWLNVAGDDKYNKEAILNQRNLNFKSTIWEGSVCAEINLLLPELFNPYPYVFSGVGFIRFNPYTYDKDNKKTYLQPLGTEGQGLSGYPDRKIYALTQLCLPLGGGVKCKLNEKYDLVYELGYRFLFTDYLDDVSTNYADEEILLANKGEKSVELAYRPPPGVDRDYPKEGARRGNPEINDGYFFTGIKLVINLGKVNEED
jgi:hypothetical protein